MLTTTTLVRNAVDQRKHCLSGLLHLGGRGAITTRAHGTGWMAETQVRDKDGVTRAVRRTGATKGEARRRLLEGLTQRRAPGGGEITAASTLADLITAWLNELERTGTRSPQTMRVYRSSMVKPLLSMGKLRLGECTAGVLAARLAPLEQETPTRARQARIVLRGAFGHAVRLGALDANPVRDLLTVPKKRPEPRALTLEEVRELRRLFAPWRQLVDQDGRRWLGPAPTSQLSDFLEIALGTGVRIGEGMALRWEDVDLIGDVPSVRVCGTVVWEKGVGLYRQAWTKGKRPRVIALPCP